MNVADAEAYWALRLRALNEHPEAFGCSPEEHPPLAEIVEAFETCWQADENCVLGAFLETESVGTARFVRETGRKVRHKGGVFGMYVAPEARGQGVGRALLEEVLANTQRLEGIEQLHLSFTKQNAAVKTLYLSCGFRVYATELRALKIGQCAT